MRAPGQVKPRRRPIEQVIGSFFDFEEKPKRTLAAPRTPLTKAERKEFVEVFKAFLSDRYAGKLERCCGEQHVIPPGARGTIV